MALQSSGAISLSDIKTELGSSANDFRSLHAAAGFSTPDSISEFYGYSAAPTLTAVITGVGAFPDPGDACGVNTQDGSQTLYYDTFAENGRFYANSDGEPFNGEDGYWYVNYNERSYFVLISTDGVIGEIGDCK